MLWWFCFGIVFNFTCYFNVVCNLLFGYIAEFCLFYDGVVVAVLVCFLLFRFVCCLIWFYFVTADWFSDFWLLMVCYFEFCWNDCDVWSVCDCYLDFGILFVLCVCLRLVLCCLFMLACFAFWVLWFVCLFPIGDDFEMWGC